MNEHPKVSIVVPAYNAAGYIEGCANSVLTQSCGSFELIIVNDGSKDDTAAVVSAMAEKDARVKMSRSSRFPPPRASMGLPPPIPKRNM